MRGKHVAFSFSDMEELVQWSLTSCKDIDIPRRMANYPPPTGPAECNSVPSYAGGACAGTCACNCTYRVCVLVPVATPCTIADTRCRKNLDTVLVSVYILRQKLNVGLGYYFNNQQIRAESDSTSHKVAFKAIGLPSPLLLRRVVWNFLLYEYEYPPHFRLKKGRVCLPFLYCR
jgi:hypothetical protein